MSENAGLVVTDPAVAVTLYGPPAVPLAVKVSASWPTVPVLAVMAVMLAVLLEKAPLGPELGAVKVTDWFGMATPAASVTSTVNGVVNAAPVSALCVPPAATVMLAGTCVTGTLLSVPEAAVPELVCTGSPPPYALAVFDTVIGDVAGTFTFRTMVDEPLAAIAVEDVQLTEFVPVPVHVQPVPE